MANLVNTQAVVGEVNIEDETVVAVVEVEQPVSADLTIPTVVTEESNWRNVEAEAETLAAGSDASAVFTMLDDGVKFTFGIPQGIQGVQGDDGPMGTITSVVRTSGTGAPGTTDTYTATCSDGSTFTFNVYNGRDGLGSGDMSKSVYDTHNKNRDIFDYADLKYTKPTDGIPMDDLSEDVQEAIEEGGGSIGRVVNLLIPTGATQTIGNITCTANGDGTYTVNGTNGTSAVNFNIGIASVTSGVKMVGCPVGGGSDTYRLRASDNAVEYVDYGVGVKIETTSTYNIYINIRPNAVCNNLIFKPMLTTNLSATYGDFVPYGYGNPVGNPNLLDNGWFTVNQRGSHTYSGNEGYFSDRWQTTWGTVEDDVNGLKITPKTSASDNGVAIFQKFENEYILGKVVTLSIKMGNGTVSTVTGTMPTVLGDKDEKFINIDGIEYDAWFRLMSDGKPQITIRKLGVANLPSFIVRAIKLELGSTSTLALDSAPDYVTELAKCRRHFLLLGGDTITIGYGFCPTNALARVTIPQMLTYGLKPTNVLKNGNMYIHMGNTQLLISAVSLDTNGYINCTISGATTNAPCIIRGNQSYGYIALYDSIGG